MISSGKQTNDQERECTVVVVGGSGASASVVVLW